MRNRIESSRKVIKEYEQKEELMKLGKDNTSKEKDKEVSKYKKEV